MVVAGVIPAVFAVAAVALGWRTVRGWSDRPHGQSLWLLAGCLVCLVFPAAVLDPRGQFLVPALLLCLVGLLPAVAVFVEWRQRRERLAQRDWAVASGLVAEDEARRSYRRQPRGAVTILAIYYVLSLVTMFVLLGVLLLLGRPDLLETPAFRPSTGGYELPWWIGGIAVLLGIGTCHMLVNLVRRP